MKPLCYGCVILLFSEGSLIYASCKVGANTELIRTKTLLAKQLLV